MRIDVDRYWSMTTNKLIGIENRFLSIITNLIDCPVSCGIWLIGSWFSPLTSSIIDNNRYDQRTLQCDYWLVVDWPMSINNNWLILSTGIEWFSNDQLSSIKTPGSPVLSWSSCVTQLLPSWKWTLIELWLMFDLWGVFDVSGDELMLTSRRWPKVGKQIGHRNRNAWWPF